MSGAEFANPVNIKNQGEFGEERGGRWEGARGRQARLHAAHAKIDFDGGARSRCIRQTKHEK